MGVREREREKIPTGAGGPLSHKHAASDTSGGFVRSHTNRGLFWLFCSALPQHHKDMQSASPVVVMM